MTTPRTHAGIRISIARDFFGCGGACGAEYDGAEYDGAEYDGAECAPEPSIGYCGLLCGVMLGLCGRISTLLTCEVWSIAAGI